MGENPEPSPSRQPQTTHACLVATDRQTDRETRDLSRVLTPATTVKLLDDLKAGRPVKIGPQNDRIHSEGPMGRTSLIGEASGPQCRDLSGLPLSLAK